MRRMVATFTVAGIVFLAFAPGASAFDGDSSVCNYGHAASGVAKFPGSNQLFTEQTDPLTTNKNELNAPPGQSDYVCVSLGPFDG
jgi:hypothetical protein